jgi:hypothetical protein
MKNIISSYINILLVIALLVISVWARFDLESFSDFFKLSNILYSRASFLVCSILLFLFVIYPSKHEKSQDTGFTKRANGIQSMFLLLLAFGSLYLSISGYDFK